MCMHLCFFYIHGYECLISMPMHEHVCFYDGNIYYDNAHKRKTKSNQLQERTNSNSFKIELMHAHLFIRNPKCLKR